METRNVTAGVTPTLARSGGGGYGDRFTRPAELVLRDVRDRYVSPTAAKRDDGVVIDDGGEVDEAATEAPPAAAPQGKGRTGALARH